MGMGQRDLIQDPAASVATPAFPNPVHPASVSTPGISLEQSLDLGSLKELRAAPWILQQLPVPFPAQFAARWSTGNALGASGTVAEARFDQDLP